MKDYQISHESMMLDFNGNNLPLSYFEHEAELDIKYIENNVREGLTNSLGDLSGSVRDLILLLEDNNIVNLLPEIALPQYMNVLDTITQDAVNSIKQITKSQEFEGIKFLSSYPVFECNVIQ